MVASVESFANYLNTFVDRGADGVNAKSRADWLNESQHEYPLADDFAGKRLSREQALRREVERWQCMWQDERTEKEKLVDELANRHKEWKRREQALGLEYKKEMNDLKQNIFVLESRLKDLNLETDKKRRVAKGGNLKVGCQVFYSLNVRILGILLDRTKLWVYGIDGIITNVYSTAQKFESTSMIYLLCFAITLSNSIQFI